ncbi:MAG: MBL fold metallo-hydrolase, partial [Sporomusaceae bacterium]|nr:MBL fold metallo-hydrolase [Sporomusaceae bacterium]
MKMVQFHFYGHACFALKNGEHTLLFDPYISENPFQTAKINEIDCTHIFISHGHGDHLGDAIAIAKRTGALVITTAEIAHKCTDEGCKAHPMHIGGTRTFDFGKVRITPAFHGSGIPGGHAAGFIV